MVEMTLNMLVPREDTAYEAYKSVRGDTYLGEGVSYNPNTLYADSSGARFGSQERAPHTYKFRARLY